MLRVKSFLCSPCSRCDFKNFLNVSANQLVTDLVNLMEKMYLVLRLKLTTFWLKYQLNGILILRISINQQYSRMRRKEIAVPLLFLYTIILKSSLEEVFRKHSTVSSDSIFFLGLKFGHLILKRLVLWRVLWLENTDSWIKRCLYIFFPSWNGTD